MYIRLLERRYGIHKPIKDLEIPCEFSDVYLADGSVNEDLLLKSIPVGWLPARPEDIVLSVRDKYGFYEQHKTSRFQPWQKYLDTYCLEILEVSLW